MGGEFWICHNRLVLCTMNPPIQAATVGSREIWEEKSAGLCGSGSCESALRGRSNEPCWKIQQQPIIGKLCKPMSVFALSPQIRVLKHQDQICRGKYCSLVLGNMFEDICDVFGILGVVLGIWDGIYLLFGLVDTVFGTVDLALGIVCLAFEIVYLGWSMVKKEMVFHRYRMWVSLTS